MIIGFSQAGAVNKSLLRDILDFTDIDKLRERATPHNQIELSDAKKNLIRTMADNNYSVDKIAERLGVSTSTVTKYL